MRQEELGFPATIDRRLGLSEVAFSAEGLDPFLPLGSIISRSGFYTDGIEPGSEALVKGPLPRRLARLPRLGGFLILAGGTTAGEGCRKHKQTDQRKGVPAANPGQSHGSSPDHLKAPT
jgi:hypothetical protein